MTGLSQLVRCPQPRLRLSALLVFGLLIGLVGMHGLAPAGMSMPEHRMSAAAAHGVVVASVPDDCGSGGHGCDGQTHHADPTCAAGSVAAAPALPALIPSPVCAPDEAQVRLASVPDVPEGGRAPPSLAELQLLRI
ncbi:DUF6153 family protein [Streptomyces sp.]